MSAEVLEAPLITTIEPSVEVLADVPTPGIEVGENQLAAGGICATRGGGNPANCPVRSICFRSDGTLNCQRLC
jgi:hypothetical protein